jgi:hypothetical protein
MTEEELYFAVAQRAGRRVESREVAALRAFTHQEMMDGRIDGATQDRIGELIDRIARSQRSQVGDLIGPNAADIPWDVLEVENCDGDVWRRAFGEDRYFVDDAGDHDGYVYDWMTEGGRSSTEGLLVYVPLTVTRVVTRP